MEGLASMIFYFHVWLLKLFIKILENYKEEEPWSRKVGGWVKKIYTYAIDQSENTLEWEYKEIITSGNSTTGEWVS